MYLRYLIASAIGLSSFVFNCCITLGNNYLTKQRKLKCHHKSDSGNSNKPRPMQVSNYTSTHEHNKAERERDKERER